MTPAVALRAPEALALWRDEPQLRTDHAAHAAPLTREHATPHAATVVPAVADLSLATRLETAWAGLARGFVDDCLLCGGTVVPRWSAGAGVVAGRCGSCGTEVS